MKKEELIKIVEEQKHLAQAVEAKDREIAELRKYKDEVLKLRHASEAVEAKDREIAELRKYKDEVLKLRHASEAVIAKDKEIIELNKLNQELKTKSGAYAGLETRVKQLEEENKLLVAFVNPYINTFRSTLKGIQGALELGIELEALLSEKLAKK